MRPGALVGRAARHLAAGRLAAAEAACRAALHRTPDDPRALHLLGAIALRCGDAPAAQALVERALALSAPSAPATYWLTLADARARLGALDGAAAAVHGALQVDACSPAAHLALAHLLGRLGDPRGAVASFRRALALDPDAPVYDHLGAALAELGLLDEAEVAFRAALAARPGAPGARVNLAVMSARRGRPDEAEAALRALLAEVPADVPALVGLALLRQQQGDLAETALLLERALQAAPADLAVRAHLGRAHLGAGRTAEARAVAEGGLVRSPGHSGMMAILALTAGSADQAEQARGLGRFVRVQPLPAPDGFDDVAAFTAVLAAEVCAHPTLTWAPASHATQAGLHSGALLAGAGGAIAALATLLDAAVESYWADLGAGAPQQDPHPFVRHRPAAVYRDVWAVVLEAGGHQLPHIHPDAWLSGVYYVALPDQVAHGPGPDGWLEFGAPDFPVPRAPAIPARLLRPVAGTLVLFPAYLYHRTVPFTGDGQRISIAFDVLPAGAAP